jgi:hypothetical protein
MWRRLLIPAVLLVLAIVIWAAVTLPAHMVGVYQRSVTQSLLEWKTEYSTIESQHDAVRTAEMLEYVQWYYVPGDGYRSTPEIEAVVQSQRQDTIDAFVAALRNYTNEDFGTDSAKWLAHLESSTPVGAGSPSE